MVVLKVRKVGLTFVGRGHQSRCGGAGGLGLGPDWSAVSAVTLIAGARAESGTETVIIENRGLEMSVMTESAGVRGLPFGGGGRRNDSTYRMAQVITQLA